MLAARTIIAVKTLPYTVDPIAVAVIVIYVYADEFQGSDALSVKIVLPSSFGIPLIYGIVDSNSIQSGSGSRLYVSSSPSSSINVFYEIVFVNCYPTIASIIIGSLLFKKGLLLGTPVPATT